LIPSIVILSILGSLLTPRITTFSIICTISTPNRATIYING
jgi:hypothetical protein